MSLGSLESTRQTSARTTHDLVAACMAIGNSILNQDDLEALEYFDTAFRDGSLCNEANIASLAKQFVKDALERANQDA